MQRVPILFLMLIGLTVPAPGQGLRFAEGDYDSALEQANKEGKMLMVITVASFSEASRIMVDEVMAYEEVGEFFNQHFLGYELDAEPLAPSFRFKGFRLLNVPEYIFVDGQGEVQFRGSGYMEPGEMLQLGKDALDEDNHASTMQELFDAGDRSPMFMQRYILTMEANGKDVAKTGRNYLDALSRDELMLEPNWRILSVIALRFDSPECQYVLQNYERFCEGIGVDPVQEYLLQVYDRAYIDAVQSRDKGYLQRSHLIANTLLPGGAAKETTDQVELAYDAAVEDWESYRKSAIEWFGKYSPEEAVTWNEAAWNFYLHVEREDNWQHALKWAKKSISIERHTWNLHTKSALLHKLGRRDEAVQVMQEALELAGPESEELKKQFEFLKQ